ncbi:hypothetical protein IJT10_03670 [bacterium]|nr:hypothetical protein [bacterium]
MVMLLNDLSFYTNKNYQKVIMERPLWLLLPAVKLLFLVSIAYIFFSLDPQFLKPTEELKQMVGDASLLKDINSYNKQWSHILVLAFFFVLSFIADIINRLKVIQLHHEYRLSDFIKNPQEIEALRKLNKIQSERKK